MRRITVRALLAALVLVVTGAIVALVVNTPRVSSRAAAPPASPVAGLPATVRSPASTATQPTQTPPRSSPRTMAAATYLSTSWGVDVSWPQCGALGMPRLQPGFVAVGINGGRPFTDNPCLAKEVAYAHSRTGLTAYLNIDAPRGGDAASYGRSVGLDAAARLAKAQLVPPAVWLDVEVLNHWSTDARANVAVINAAISALQSRGLVVGIYSSVAMWQQITGGAPISVPVWLATSVTDYHQLPSYCATGLGGRVASMAQYVATDGRQLVDVDVLCTQQIPQVVSMFAAGRH